LNNGPLANPAKVAGLSIGWTFPVGAVTPAPGPFRAGPIVYKGVVYIGNSNGHFYAINANNGSVKWVYPSGAAPALTSTFTCNPSSEGIASSAMMGVIGGTDAVIFGAPDRSIGTHLGSGRIFALNAKTGAEIWKSPEVGVLRADGVTHQQIGYSSPLVFNGHVYVGLGDHCDNPIQQGKVVAVKLSDGTIDGAFNFTATGPPRGGGVWGSVAGWIDKELFVTTGNSNIGGPSPGPDEQRSSLRVTAGIGLIVWGWQPMPHTIDYATHWSATPTLSRQHFDAPPVRVTTA
jgi:outer membrane protein assembly factor BamB